MSNSVSGRLGYSTLTAIISASLQLLVCLLFVLFRSTEHRRVQSTSAQQFITVHTSPLKKWLNKSEAASASFCTDSVPDDCGCPLELRTLVCAQTHFPTVRHEPA